MVLGSTNYANRWRREAAELLCRREQLPGEIADLALHSGPLGTELTRQQAPRKVREIAARIDETEPVRQEQHGALFASHLVTNRSRDFARYSAWTCDVRKSNNVDAELRALVVHLPTTEGKFI